ncbi:HAD family hydrolase [Paraburkholderia bryophila]|uniref:HAD family hydrolase n=1 Tax=Paraburkholderia bryophila TaxID=420952 RepID=UPI00234A9FEB|nr:HAD family hydrolase [Paraburkholderia bryophila]WCM22249.1 HAD family hydrolase [Paraburkholderia bryophila]
METRSCASRTSRLPWRAVVIDLDGTLLDDQGRVSKYSAQVLEHLHRREMKIIFATGRLDVDARRSLTRLGFTPTVVSCNGTLIKTGPASPPALERTLAPASSVKILQFTQSVQLHVTLFSRAGWHALTPNAYFADYIAGSGLTCRYHTESELRSIKAFKILLQGDVIAADNAYTALRERFGKVVALSRSSAQTIDIVSPNHNKMTAVRWFLARQQIALSQTIAFGDAMNDLELLSSVGHGVVMANAMPELKRHLPKHPQAPPNHQHGVARYLDQLLAL